MSFVKVEVLDASEQTEKYAKLLAGLTGGLERAQYSAMKRAGDKARTHAGRFASARYELSKAGFDRYVQTKIDGYGTATLSIRFAGSVIPLKQFTTRSGAAGIYAKAKNGGAVIPRTFYAWFSHGKSMGGNVFIRELEKKQVKNPKRAAITKLFGPSAPQMLNDEQVKSEMDHLVTETYEERMEHEVLRLLNGW